MKPAIKFLIPFGAFLLLAVGLFQVRQILLPFVLAAAIAYLVQPLIRIFDVYGFKHERVAVTVYVALMMCYFGGIYLIVALAAQEAGRLASDLPSYSTRLQAILQSNAAGATQFPVLRDLGAAGWLKEHLNVPALLGNKWWMTLTPVVAGRLFPFLEMMLLVPFLTFFFLLDAPRVKDALFAIVPPGAVEAMLHLVTQIDHGLGGYLRGTMMQSFIIGTAAGIGFWLIGLHYYLQLALWVMLTSAIPLVGLLSAALAAVIAALLQWGTLGGLIKALTVYLIIHLLNDWLIGPLIMRRSVNIHPVTMVFSMMAGTVLAGFWGVVFAIPLVTTLKVFGKVVGEWYGTEIGLPFIPKSEERPHAPLS